MKTIKYILKGILLWFTCLSILSFLAGGLECLIETNHRQYAFYWILLNLALIYACYFNLSYKEVYILSGTHWLNKILKKLEAK